MKPIKQRTWSGDFEVISKGANGYEEILLALNKITRPESEISKIKEEWFEVENKIDIKVSYVLEGRNYSILTGSSRDFFSLNVLLFLNLQQGFVGNKFECSMKEESIYFINQTEKTDLENQGVKFERLDPVYYLPSITHNILYNSSIGNIEFTDQLIRELNNGIEDYYYENLETKNRISILQNYLRTKLIPALNWKRINEMNLKTENIFNFMNLFSDNPRRK